MSMGIVFPLGPSLAAVSFVRASIGGSLAPETALFLTIASKLKWHIIVVSDRFLLLIISVSGDTYYHKVDRRAETFRFKLTFLARQLSQAK